MAVDANVLIHERIKEELARGKSLVKAVEEGHTKSYSAIFDSNITSLITGLILFYFGLGPVLGYATTLNIGIVLTIFTAVFMGHIMFNFALKRNLSLKFTTRISRNNFTNRNIPFVSKRKLGYIISGAVCLLMLASILLKGFTFGVDFTGGRAYTIRFDQDVNTSEVRKVLADKLGEEPIVKTYGTSNQIKITTGYLEDNNSTQGDSIVNHAIYEGLQQFLPANLAYEDFHDKYQLRSEVIGPSISEDIQRSAIKAIVFGFLGIFLYILFRFRKWQFATGTLIALAHDILILTGIFSLFSGILPFSLDVDETFIAAILTVMGYSVNDKVVVFDRVREFLREHLKGNTRVVINDALNNTLNRTIMTNVTVMIVLLILFIFGGEVIRGFVFALIIGLLICTYSSIFIAAPLVVDLSKEKEMKSFDTTTPTAPKSRVPAK
jgi:SecD/SecF fusion protein